MEGYSKLCIAEIYVKNDCSINTKNYKNNTENLKAAVEHSNKTNKFDEPVLYKEIEIEPINNDRIYENNYNGRKDSFNDMIRENILYNLKEIIPVLVDELVDSGVKKIKKHVINFKHLLNEEPKAIKLLREEEIKNRNFTLITNQRKVG